MTRLVLHVPEHPPGDSNTQDKKPMRTGTVTRKTAASLPLTTKALITPPKTVSGAFAMIRSDMDTVFRICRMSLVKRPGLGCVLSALAPVQNTATALGGMGLRLVLQTCPAVTASDWVRVPQA